MTGPKHLWAGNWEDESSPSHAPTLLRKTEPAPTPAQPVEPGEPPRSPRTPPNVRRRAVVAGATLAVIVVAVALALTTAGGASRPKAAAVTTPTARAPSLAATTPTPTTTQPAPSGPPVYWLGMELVTVQPGGATVETLKLGSEGDRAGLSPGDVILEINGRQVSGADGIASAISGKRAGDRVALQISHGSALYTTVMTLGASPTRQP
jgi:S1-C subfamily serine protease